MTRSTNKKERLSDKNPAWFNERWEVFELYWENKINKQEFQKRIEEIDFKYKHPEEFMKKDIEKTQREIDEYRKEYEITGKIDEEKIEEMKALIEKYEQLKEEIQK